MKVLTTNRFNKNSSAFFTRDGAQSTFSSSLVRPGGGASGRCLLVPCRLMTPIFSNEAVPSDRVKKNLIFKKAFSSGVFHMVMKSPTRGVCVSRGVLPMGKCAS